jgi:uncharacterized protein Usg
VRRPQNGALGSTVSSSQYLKSAAEGFKAVAATVPSLAGSSSRGRPLMICFQSLFCCAATIASACLLLVRDGGQMRRDVTLYELQAKGYRLTTAEIVYRLPDHPALLQTFIWQKFDLAPDFPELNKFLEFWRGNIEGKLHSVNIKQSSRTVANRFRHFKHQLTLH